MKIFLKICLNYDCTTGQESEFVIQYFLESNIEKKINMRDGRVVEEARLKKCML